MNEYCKQCQYRHIGVCESCQIIPKDKRKNKMNWSDKMNKNMWDKEEIKKKICNYIDKCYERNISFDVSSKAIIETADGKVLRSKIDFKINGSFED
jgi:hypothetical protein